jgi:hypothetical protein
MSITVRGIPEVQRSLAAFPRQLVMSTFAKALGRAAAVFEAELSARVPEGMDTTSSENYGTLLDNLCDEITIDAQGRGGKLQVGFGRKGMVALWVEYGHRMVSHSKKELGTVQPHPFMRPAFEAAADRAVDVFIDSVREYMQSGSIAA